MIYKEGKELIPFNMIKKVNYNKDNNIAVEPLEQGSFSSDSKQNTAYDLTLSVVKDAGTNDRDTLMRTINILDNLADNPTLVDIKTPYKVYTNVALKKFSYELTIDQLGLHAELGFKQIRLTDIEYSSAKFKRPNNKPYETRGKVQPNGPQPADTTFYKGTLKPALNNIKNYFNGN